MADAGELLPEPSPPRLVRRWILRLLLPGVVVLAGAIAALHLRDRDQDRELALRAAQGVLTLQARLFERELEVVASTAVYLAQQSSVQQFVAGTGARNVVEADFLAFCRQSRSFDQLRILDAEGMEVVRVNYNAGQPVSVPEDQLQQKSNRYYFQIAAGLPTATTCADASTRRTFLRRRSSISCRVE